jgi:NADPH:quinone reductase-like Zn-dependent oxidoreductase
MRITEPATTQTGVTMQAIVQSGYGSPDVLSLATVERPTIAANEVLIRVRAAAVDRGTWHVMAGRPYAIRLALGRRRPRNRVPGMDVAGTVVAVGPNVTKFTPGDDVFGISRGSFAEYAAAREDKLAPKPAALTFDQAAAVPVSAVTALHGLRDAGRIQPGQHVLIIGASGGVGTFAVQLAKAFGAEITAVCSTTKLDLVRSLGADHVIDYTRGAITGHHDLILDIAGNRPLSQLRRTLTPRGTLVIAGAENAGDWLGLRRQFRALLLSPFLRQRLTTFVSNPRHTHLETLTELINTGHLIPHIGATYPLADVPKALHHLESGQTRGKIAITI